MVSSRMFYSAEICHLRLSCVYIPCFGLSFRWCTMGGILTCIAAGGFYFDSLGGELSRFVLGIGVVVGFWISVLWDWWECWNFCGQSCVGEVRSFFSKSEGRVCRVSANLL